MQSGGGQVAPGGEKGGREEAVGVAPSMGPKHKEPGARRGGQSDEQQAGRGRQGGAGRHPRTHPSIPAGIHPSIHPGGSGARGASGDGAHEGARGALRGHRIPRIPCVVLVVVVVCCCSAALLLCCAALLPSSLHSSHGRGSLFRHQHLGPRGQDIRGLRWRRLWHHEARVSQGKSTDPSQALGYGILGETGGC